MITGGLCHNTQHISHRCRVQLLYFHTLYTGHETIVGECLLKFLTQFFAVVNLNGMSGLDKLVSTLLLI